MKSEKIGVRWQYCFILFAHWLLVCLTPCDAQYARLYDFVAAQDGGAPRGGLVASKSKVFGTNSNGGFGNRGTIWSFDTESGSFDKLHDFDLKSDGGIPFGGIALRDNTLFGTSYAGGSSGDGTVWMIDTNSNTFNKLHDFDGLDGEGPYGGVAVANGVVYGTTALGGEYSRGTFWSLNTTTNTFTNLHDFLSVDGWAPRGGVTIMDSMIIGTTRWGGAYGDGTVWAYDMNGQSFTTLHHFEELLDGVNPESGIAVSGTEVFGTTSRGGNGGTGTLWSYDIADDSFSTLFDFGINVGGVPIGELAIVDNTIYGTGVLGVNNPFGSGTLWSFDLDGLDHQVLYEFNSDGEAFPNSGVVNSDGKIVGTSRGGTESGAIWAYAIPEPGSLLGVVVCCLICAPACRVCGNPWGDANSSN